MRSSRIRSVVSVTAMGLLGCMLSAGIPEGSAASASASADESSGNEATHDPSNATNASASAGESASDTSTTTSADETSSTTADDGNFIRGPDGGPGGVCFAWSPCDVWAQDCSDGFKCNPTSCNPNAREPWNATICTEVALDPAAVGEPCTTQEGPYSGIDDCELDAMCWNVDPTTLQGECVAFCTGPEAEPTCGDAARTCFVGFDGTVIACLPACDPFASTCAANEECIADEQAKPDAFVCIPDTLASALAYGDECSKQLMCATGLMCREAADVPGCATAECCTALGELAAPPDCPDAMQTCITLYPEGDAPDGLEDVCYCGVPE